MINLIQFEMKKIIMKKKFLVSLLIFFAVISLFYIDKYVRTNIVFVKYKLEENQINLESLQQSVAQATKILNEQNGFLNEKAKKDLEEDINKKNELVEVYIEKGEEIRKENWEQVLVLENKQYEYLKEHISIGKVQGASVSELSMQIEKNRYMIENKIDPILEEATINSYNGLKLTFKYLFPMILPIFILLVCGDAFASEVEDGTYKILYIQPVKKIKLFLSKIISNYIVCIAGVCIVLLLIFLLSGILVGFGSGNYPFEYFKYNNVLFNNINNIKENIILISLSDFTLKGSIFYLCFSLFLVIFTSLISNILNESTIAISVSILICIIFYINNVSLKIFSKFLHFIPFTYLDFSSVYNGNLIFKFDNPNITSAFSFFSMFIISFILLITSFILFNKKQTGNM